METSTKERLTGALLVVLALVIVIPELLSGGSTTERGTPPAQNPEEGAPLQTYDVQLDGSAVAPAAPRDVPAAAAAEIAAVPPPVTSTEAPPLIAASPAPAPAPAAAAVVGAPHAAKVPANPAAAVEDKAPGSKPSTTAESAKTPASAPTPAAASGKWWVQLGSFASRDNAQQLAGQLRAAGFTIELARSSSKGKELYRVRAGPVRDRDAASELQVRLAAVGEKKSSLVAP